MVVPRLGDEADGIGLRFEQSRDAGIVRDRAPGPLRHAEGGELGVLRALLGKERGVERVRARIAALHVIDAEPVEERGDRLLVLEREIDAGRLRAVAQGGVEEIDAFAAHDDNFLSSWRRQALFHGGGAEPFVAERHGVAALRLEIRASGRRAARCR